MKKTYINEKIGSSKARPVFKVRVGEYADTTWYVVKGAQNEQDALNKVHMYLKKTYGRTYWSEGECSVAEIKLNRRGVTEL